MTKGDIQFDKLSLKYRPNTDTVLKNLSLNIKGGDKIGVVGRTGAGKSTIIQAITRIVAADKGSIHIDGQDISRINLIQLR